MAEHKAPSLVDPLEADRRALARYHLNLEAACHSIAAGGKDMHPARVCDVSARGIGVLLGRRHEPGSLLSLELQDGPQTIQGTLLVRVANVRERKGTGWLHGCAFASHLNGNDMQAAFRVILSRPPAFERRILLRYQFAMGATGRAISTSAKEPWAGTTQDISAGGIALVMDKRLQAGSLITIKLQSQTELFTRALMARVLHARARDKGGWVHGCSFPSKLREDELQTILRVGWTEVHGDKPYATQRLEALKLALADQIERNALDEARGTIAAVLELDPGDPDALAAGAFLDSFVEPPAPLCEVRQFKGHKSSVNTAAFSVSGQLIMSGSGIEDDLQLDEDRSVRFWDVDKGYETFNFHGHKSPITSVAFAQRGARALSADRTGTINLWDIERRRVLRQFERYAGVTSLAFSVQGRFVLSGGDDRLVRLWDADFGRCMRYFKAHTAEVTSVIFLPDERSAASAGMDSTIRLWNLEAQHKHACLDGHDKGVMTLACSADGKLLLSGSADNSIRLWDLASKSQVRRFDGHSNVVNSVALSPDGKWVLSGSADNSVRLWELETGRELLSFNGHAQSVKCVAFAPDGRHALSASADHTIRLWDLPQ